MAQKSKSSFRGKVASNAQETSKAGASYGYLKLPKGISVFNPDPDGRYKLDFLPYEVTDPRHPDRKPEAEQAVPGSLWYRRPFKVHRNVGGAEGDTCVCLTSIGRKCPICEHKVKMAKEGAGKDDLKALNYSKRILYLVIPLDSKKHEQEIHIFDIAERNFQDLLTEELKENEDNEIFPDLQEGKSLKVRFEATTFANSKPYPVASRIDFVDRDEVYDDSILKEVPNLDEILNILSYQELEAKFLEIEEPDGGELKEQEEEKPTRSKFSRPVPKEEPEDEPEEEKPKRTLRKPVEESVPQRRKPVPVEEEPEEEEKPAARKSTSTPSRNSKSERCPYGHKFGVDTDKFKECDTCDEWTDCIAEKEK